MDFNKLVNLNKLTWMLNVALTGAVFSIFSLIYNDYFIYYGFITFVYGIVAHLLGNTFDYFIKGKIKYINIVFQCILIFIWVYVLIKIY